MRLHEKFHSSWTLQLAQRLVWFYDLKGGFTHTRLTTDISTTPEVGPTDSTTQDENIVVDFLPCVPLYQNQQLR
ncbi:uncharacterized protein YALI1_A14150g [Yarrowia lipolytica]|uniref:Uncharacterized protein n=1 Tax=Yarrowia lipolytica TaxID=4952 RepID=A0A1D8N4R2_YARLL|nr:hypothetical protein YALI1_A14150g [Yarrowia lipolytica]